MTTRATGSFEVKSFDETTYDDIGGGSKLTRAHAVETFHGDIEGEGVVDYLMAYGADGTSQIIGLLRVTGSLGRRSGSIVLDLHGKYKDQQVELLWSVVSGAGTGDLLGMRGGGGVLPFGGMSADWVLDYHFEK